MKIHLGLGLGLGLLLMFSACYTVSSKCSRTCDALASYYVQSGATLNVIADLLDTTADQIMLYNSIITNKDSLPSFIRINVPFTCDCIKDQFLGHMFNYSVQSGDTYTSIAQTNYSGLTTADWIQAFNSYSANNIPDNVFVNVTVNCSCGDSSISKDYGLFITYPLRANDSLASIANASGVSSELLTKYNPTVDFNAGSGIVYVPGKGEYVLFSIRRNC